MSRSAFLKKILICFLVLSVLTFINSTMFYKVTASSALKIGDYIYFGSYNDEPILWRVINIDKEGDPLLISEKVLAFKPFDSMGEKHTNSNDERVKHGSNFWRDSNIRQWLNSSEGEVSWIQNPPSTVRLLSASSASDMIPTERLGAYDKEKGFLADGNFTEQERHMIKEVKNKSLISQSDVELKDGGVEPFKEVDWQEKGISNYETAYFHYVDDKIFLLDVKELLQYVGMRGFSLKARPTAKAARNFAQADVYSLDSSMDCDYWLRTPNTDHNYYAKYVTRDGEVRNYGRDVSVCNYIGIRPALYLRSALAKFKSGIGSKDYPYNQAAVEVSIDKASITIEKGNADIIPYTLTPLSKIEWIRWSTSDNKVATISEFGIVKGINVGTATIKAETPSGSTSSCKITVTPPQKHDNALKKYSYNSSTLSKSTVDERTNYIDGYQQIYGGTSEFFDKHGRLNIVYEGEKKLHIITLNEKMTIVKKVEITKELEDFGAATCDDKGFIYVLWGKSIDHLDKTNKNIIVAKYNGEGKKVASLPYISGNTNTAYPFNHGNAELSYSNGIIAAYFGRNMLLSKDGKSHQSSFGMFINSKKMTPLDIPIPYVSHSMDQQVIPTSKGGFLFADRGDGYPRGFKVSEVFKNDSDIYSLKGVTPFHFREGAVYQDTFSQLGGIAEIETGYVLVGASEKTLSREPAPSVRNEPRNLFVQIIKKDFDHYHISPLTQDNMVLKANKRVLQGKRDNSRSRFFLPESDELINYGVKWLTNYTGARDAANPKMVSIGNNKILVLWETFNKGAFEGTYYLVLSMHGDILRPPTLLKNARLTITERPIYRGGKVYWTVADHKMRTVECYVFDICKIIAIGATAENDK